MNKMTKGAIATGVGVALLLGGGGTLALWNEATPSEAGTVVAGDLDLESEKYGAWSNELGAIKISTYRVVPGEVLTFTKTLDITLDGDRMEAQLSLIGAGIDNGFGDNVDVETVFLKNGDTVGSEILRLSGDAVITAKTTFTFKSETGEGFGQVGIESTEATYDFSDVKYELRQLPLGA